MLEMCMYTINYNKIKMKSLVGGFHTQLEPAEGINELYNMILKNYPKYREKNKRFGITSKIA